MRKSGLLLVIFILIGLASLTSSTVTPQFKQPSRDELIENLMGIEQFSFQENTSGNFNITLKVGNLTRNSNVSIVYQRSGYLDLRGRVAEINTTTTTFPGGASVFTRDVIIDDDVYFFMGGNWIKLTRESFGISPSIVLNMTWEYNIVNFTLRYLKKKPHKDSFENGSYILYYLVTTQDLRRMAGLMLGENTNVSFNVTDGILELRFVGGRLVGGRLGYRINIHIWGEELGKRADVYETGNVYDEFTITSVNVKKRVEVPKSYRA